MEIKYTRFEDLLDKEQAYEDLIPVIQRNSYSKGTNKKRAENLQKLIIKKFLKILLEEIMDHKVFYFPKKILSLQIGTTKRPKSYEFKYDADNTIAICVLRTSFRFFKKMKNVKPFVRLRNDWYYKVQKIHAEKTQYYNK